MNNKIPPYLNNASYYINHLLSLDISTWHTTGGSITQPIKHIGLNKHHRWTVERICKMMTECIEKGVQYRGGKYSKHAGRPYLLKYSNEPNIISDYIENVLAFATQPLL